MAPVQGVKLSWKLPANLKERLYILNYLGSLLWLLGMLMLLPLLPWYIYDEAGSGISALSFLAPAISCMALGLIIQREFSYRTPSIRGAMIITALGWMVCGIAGAIPYVLGLHKGLVDALFESVSGFTTTGITLLQGLDEMPRSILFWRSLTQWLGGLGILSFFMAVGFRGQAVGGASVAAALFSAEGHKMEVPRPAPGIFHTLLILWSIYCGFTVASGLCFWAAGMSGFDALNHSLTCISTGGFSTHDASLGYWQRQAGSSAWLIELVAVLFMLAGGTSFLIHFRLMTGRFRQALGDFEFRIFSGALAICVVLVVLDHLIRAPCPEAGVESAGPLGYILYSIRVSVFQVSSLITSTGYLTTDINSPFFPAMSRQILLFLMVVGGCVGSTAGGIKMLRAGVLAKLMGLEVKRLLLPRRAVMPVVISGRIVPDSEIHRIAALSGIWFLLLAIGAMVTAMLSDLGPWQALSGMASALGNMGPCYFSVDEMARLHPVIKCTYIAGMLAGRLEIMPLAVVSAIVFRRI